MSRLVTGPRFVLEALRGPGAGSITAILVESREGRGTREVVEAAERLGIPVQTRTRRELDALTEGVRHQGVVARLPEYHFHELDEILARPAPLLLVALDEITDPHNFGAIVRSAVAFGADGVLVPKHRSATVTPVVARASAGAVEHARIARVTNLQRTLAQLAEEGLLVVGLAADGEVPLDQLPPAPAGRVVVVGSEGKGLRRMVRERCEVVARIPQVGPVDSLNASVAAGIALYEAARQREAAHG